MKKKLYAIPNLNKKYSDTEYLIVFEKIFLNILHRYQDKKNRLGINGNCRVIDHYIKVCISCLNWVHMRMEEMDGKYDK